MGTWWDFPRTTRAWWDESDMLFVGYPSTKDDPQAVAARLARYLPIFYPALPDALLEVGNVRVRPTSDSEYDELYLVGHSLGGVILRRMVSELAHEWELSGAATPVPTLLTGQLRFFAPASAGFRAAGLLGFVKASPAWKAINLRLRMSSAYTDLQPGSSFLTETQRRTQDLVRAHTSALASLRAYIVWANPDDVVQPERYDSDHLTATVDGTSHSSVCKPHDRYQAPWLMVETGRPL